MFTKQSFGVLNMECECSSTIVYGQSLSQLMAFSIKPDYATPKNPLASVGDMIMSICLKASMDMSHLFLCFTMSQRVASSIIGSKKNTVEAQFGCTELVSSLKLPLSLSIFLGRHCVVSSLQLISCGVKPKTYFDFWLQKLNEKSLAYLLLQYSSSLNCRNS